MFILNWHLVLKLIDRILNRSLRVACQRYCVYNFYSNLRRNNSNPSIFDIFYSLLLKNIVCIKFLLGFYSRFYHLFLIFVAIIYFNYLYWIYFDIFLICFNFIFICLYVFYLKKMTRLFLYSINYGLSYVILLNKFFL